MEGTYGANVGLKKRGIMSSLKKSMTDDSTPEKRSEIEDREDTELLIGYKFEVLPR